jgi:valyl-tRNA synthetase
MKDKLTKPYSPQETEDSIYTQWIDSGFFNPDICIEKGATAPDAVAFSIVLPPPNVTGTLHMGSAFMIALEDTMTRFARMQGKKTLWLPGTDHAAIATQSKVEKDLQKSEGKNRHDLGREEFLKRVNAFAQDSHDTIVNQIKKLGASIDWSREAFTLDEKRNFAVRTAFKQMYDDGLIYRGYKVVNWDPKGQTTISDDEIVYEERKATLYTFKYSKDFPIAIATTRLETKVGDTAVAVHPDDPRYAEFVGKTFDVDFMGEKLLIKIIADESVEKDFGTGALGVTPAHSQIDWDMSQKHNLPLKQVINEYAKMSVDSPALSGKKTTEAREIVAQWLRDNNLMIEEKEIDQNVSTAERTGGIIEPLPKLQWFINVNKEFAYPHASLPHIKKGDMVSLKKLMLSVVADKDIDILPDRFEKVYTHWIENLRDWCISRQIWYGHRIPVWYRASNDEIRNTKYDKTESDSREVYCGIDTPSGDGWEQDPDTLDTWFSSGLWTFSTLGWPEQTDDLKTYHPTTVLETGYDILFFWVARMILMSTYLVGQIPFKTVYLHGLVRDNQNRKISKSLGNNIDPLDMIAKYGADAVRMALIIGTGPGNDSKIADDKFKAYKHFANKLWNIARFVQENSSASSEKPTLAKKDIELLTSFNALITDVTKEMEEYKFYLAGEKLYAYIWHTFADSIIEESKDIIGSAFGDNPKPGTGTDDDKKSRQWLLQHILKTSLILLHPFMPFITEELWTVLGYDNNNGDNILMVTRWPVVE